MAEIESQLMRKQPFSPRAQRLLKIQIYNSETRKLSSERSVASAAAVALHAAQSTALL